VDSHSIRKNQVLLIITAIFFQFHLPYFSLLPSQALAIDTDEGLIEEVLAHTEAKTDVFSLKERGIPYRDAENSDSDRDDTIMPTLLGIHITAPHGATQKVRNTSSLSGGARTILVTAYSSTKDQTDASPCITANGFNVCKNGAENVIAANFLPFGARVQFPEYFGAREFIVQDRMNARYSNRVDIWMKTRVAAKQFGVKRLKMVVVSDEIAQKDTERTQVAGNF
jgi:3D (Asp-Asp-Asp) domain-containing protein